MLTRAQVKKLQEEQRKDKEDTERDGVRATQLDATPEDDTTTKEVATSTSSLSNSPPPNPNPTTNPLPSSLTGHGSGSEGNDEDSCNADLGVEGSAAVAKGRRTQTQSQLMEGWTPPGPIQDETPVPDIVELSQLNRQSVIQLQKADTSLADF